MENSVHLCITDWTDTGLKEETEEASACPHFHILATTTEGMTLLNSDWQTNLLIIPLKKAVDDDDDDDFNKQACRNLRAEDFGKAIVLSF